MVAMRMHVLELVNGLLIMAVSLPSPHGERLGYRCVPRETNLSNILYFFGMIISSIVDKLMI